MAILSGNSNYQWILSLKMFLVSSGVLSMALFLKLCVPVLAEFPSVWASFITRLTPPYLYLLINFIIITILASSKLHNTNSQLPPTPTPNISSHYVHSGATHFLNEYTTHDLISDQQSATLVSEAAAQHTAISSPITITITNTNPTHSIQSFSSSDNDKPPLSERIRQRKFLKPSPEGKPLGVSKPKRQETLESTWRTITEGRSMPLTRHLRKSDTWDSHGRRASVPVDPVTPPSKVMKKSETFSGGRGSPSPSPGGSSGRLKREASQTQDELNRRVEAFIKKFNDEMRLQRQESFKQYQEMMGRPPH